MVTLANIFPSTIDDNGILVVMVVITALILAVVGIGIAFFAKWAKRDKAEGTKERGL